MEKNTQNQQFLHDRHNAIFNFPLPDVNHNFLLKYIFQGIVSFGDI
jgi:hypothetical protein